LITKTGYITLGTGLATYALSKELYIFNEETIVLTAFIGLWAAIYRGVSKPIVELRDAEAEVRG
jgi:F-type H+-transporting ATPase subunit b